MEKEPIVAKGVTNFRGYHVILEAKRELFGIRVVLKVYEKSELKAQKEHLFPIP